MSMRLRSLPAAVVAATTLATSVLGVTVAVAASPSSQVRAESAPAAAAVTAQQCVPGLNPTLSFDKKNEPSVTLPSTFVYPSEGESEPAGFGKNPSSVGYTVEVSSPTGNASTPFGPYATASGEGVPWATPDGSVSSGKVPAYALDAPGPGKYLVTITYDKPVFGIRSAITDLDLGSERMQMDAFAEATGGTAIPLDVKTLDNPSTIPELKATETHSGNTAYIQSGTSVESLGSNRFASKDAGNVDDATASVYFAYDSDSPIRRVEMTYDVTQSAGFWFVPPSVPQACVQPNFDITSVDERGVATMASTLANQAGSGRIEDIGFTYNLPEGVVVAADPKLVAPACAGTITAEPGSSTITISGAVLASGATNCDWSVDLQFTKPGTVTFDSSVISGASNVVVGGTTPTTVVVNPDSPALTATITGAVQGAGAAAPRPGDEIVYSVVVTNTGNTPVQHVRIDDALGTAITCDPELIPVGASITCTSTKPYVIPVEVGVSGVVRNTVTGSGTSAKGTAAQIPLAETTNDIVVDAPSVAATFTAAAQHEGAGKPKAGDTVTFTAKVTNTGNTAITHLKLDDVLGTALQCSTETLAIGASVDCVSSKPYVLTQADVDAGTIVNTVTGTGYGPVGQDVALAGVDAQLAIEATPLVVSDLSGKLDKADKTVRAGDTASFSSTVTNSGNVTVSTLAVTDDLGTAMTCADTSLAAGASTECVSTTPHVLTQAEIDGGVLRDSSVASGVTPKGEGVGSQRQTFEIVLPAKAAVTATIAVLPGEGAIGVGTEVSYVVTVTNTGNVTLPGAQLTASLGTVFTCPASVAPGASVDCTSTAAYVLTQADVDAGRAVNTVTGSLTSPGGATVDLPKLKGVLEIVATPSLDAEATGAITQADAAMVQADDTIVYSVVVKNTGNVTLSMLELADGQFTCDTDALAPGASATCTPVEHQLTQADVDSGSVVAGFVFDAKAPSGDLVSAKKATVHTPIDAVTGITATSTSTLEQGSNERADAGDTIAYSVTVANTGNVTLSGASLLGSLGTVFVCGDLAPGASASCDGDVPAEVTQEQLDAGMAVNTISGTVSAPATTVEIPAMDEVTELKAVTGLDADVSTALREVSGGAAQPLSADGKTLVVPGDGLVYTTTITNTGNVTVTDLSVQDWPETGSSCAEQPLAPGKSVVCTSTQPYSIQQADIDAGQAVHKASAQAYGPAHTAEQGDDTVQVDAAAPVTGKLVRSGEVTTVTPLAPVPAPPSLAITGSAGGLGAALLAGTALMLGFGGILIALARRKRDEQREQGATIR